MSLCNHISYLSCATYTHLSKMFQYQLGMSELGLTDILIYQMVDYCHAFSLSNVRVYTSGTKIESQYGNDLDIFIQQPNGMFHWFTLQAKVMSQNGAYQDLKPKKGSKSQWDKLLDHEAQYGSKSFYLLYNGKPRINHVEKAPRRSDCLGVPLMYEYGYGIVETTTVKRIRDGLKPTQNVYLKHFFPDYMDSFRKLFCCKSRQIAGRKKMTEYDYSEFSDKNSRYARIFPASEGKEERLEFDSDVRQALINDREDTQNGLAPNRIVILST